jgi:hypothetical protein
MYKPQRTEVRPPEIMRLPLCWPLSGLRSSKFANSIRNETQHLAIIVWLFNRISDYWGDINLS